MNTPQPHSAATGRPRSVPSASGNGSEMLADCCASSLTFVRKNPVTSSMIAVGLGMGVGLMIAKAINESIPKPSPPPSSMEAFGKHVLETLASSLPDSVSRHLPQQ